MEYLTIIGGAFIAWLILVVAVHAGDPVPHRGADRRPQRPLHSTFWNRSATPRSRPGNTIEILTNGPQFYPAMLEAIAGARETVNMECYIFKKGMIGDRFIEALCERAKAGVRVTIVMDTIGSFGAFHQSAKPLRAAGCRVELYHRVRWYTLARLNNRTHRELLVVDGRVAFAGGAGIADWWITSDHPQEPEGHLARFDGPHRRTGRVRHPGRDRGELAGVLRRDSDRPGHLLAAAASRNDRGVHDQELAGGSRHLVARAVSDAPRRGPAPRLDHHAVLPARPVAAEGVPAHGQARRAHRGDRAGRRHRSAVGASRQPPSVRPDARSGRADLRVPTAR